MEEWKEIIMNTRKESIKGRDKREEWKNGRNKK
jgi:hypothetical protein